MLRRFPIRWPGFVMERFGPTEGSIVGRVSRLYPHPVPVRTVQYQHSVDRAAIITDCENSIFFRYRFPQVEQSATIVPLPLLRDPLVCRGQGAEEWLGERKTILRLCS